MKNHEKQDETTKRLACPLVAALAPEPLSLRAYASITHGAHACAQQPRGLVDGFDAGDLQDLSHTQQAEGILEICGMTLRRPLTEGGGRRRRW